MGPVEAHLLRSLWLCVSQADAPVWFQFTPSHPLRSRREAVHVSHTQETEAQEGYLTYLSPQAGQRARTLVVNILDSFPHPLPSLPKTRNIYCVGLTSEYLPPPHSFLTPSIQAIFHAALTRLRKGLLGPSGFPSHPGGRGGE